MPQLLCLITVYLHTTDSKKKIPLDLLGSLLINTRWTNTKPHSGWNPDPSVNIRWMSTVQEVGGTHNRFGNRTLQGAHTLICCLARIRFFQSMTEWRQQMPRYYMETLHSAAGFVSSTTHAQTHTHSSELRIHCGVSDAALNPNGNLTQPCKPPAGRFVQ